MANLYVGSDGVIHSGNGNGVQGAVAVTTSTTGRTNADGSYSTYSTGNYNNAYYVSMVRKVFYWLFTIAAGLLIGIGVYELIGQSIFASSEATTTTESIENWFYSLAPYIFAIGGCVGSIWYGVFFAKDRSYDLGAIILAMLSAVGGVAVLALALAIVCFVVALIISILSAFFVIIIAVAVIISLFEG